MTGDEGNDGDDTAPTTEVYDPDGPLPPALKQMLEESAADLWAWAETSDPEDWDWPRVEEGSTDTRSVIEILSEALLEYGGHTLRPDCCRDCAARPRSG